VEDDSIRADRARSSQGRMHGVATLAVDYLVCRRQVAEVERMDEHAGDPGFLAASPEASEIVRCVLGETPSPRALGEELHGVGADLDRLLERSLDPATAVGAEEHPDTLAA